MGDKPLSEKQLTGWNPDEDGRKWLCALLKNEALSGRCLRREFRGTRRSDKTLAEKKGQLRKDYQC
jgi:hypothetical protein